ncbi:MAG: (2Fe-2S) ferredoxin domain-containing protein [Candidatus Andeanibacterium colombiense]|uniref:(2Fe-2S) ferredoxin domain-containing protein n=1 Tax=Candidatus Andeanibacterium colombiense TaxID=3121345 RepID=A0AAJ6BNL2_9SPHN|nr:MAG: (2Fe-2S) ferredoxin domain-containing protein [Sphingomonadaceae bacterium]
MGLSEVERAQKAFDLIGGDGIRRHIFICALSEKGKCCDRATGEAAWNFLKQRLRELGLSGPNGTVQRTKADCLQICDAGPVAVVWPDGVWYHSCTKDTLARIVDEHLVGGTPVEEFRLRPTR